MKRPEWIRKALDRTPFRVVHIGHYIRRLYFRKWMKRIPLESMKRILDAGCGAGEYSLEMAGSHPDLEVEAVDLQFRNFPGNAPSNVRFRRGNLLELDSRDAYDLIYCIDVLEHIPGNRRVMANFFRALRPGGYLYLHIPLDEGGNRIFPRRFFTEFQDWADGEHIGEQYTPGQLKNILSELGFAVSAAAYTFGYAGKLAWEMDRMTDRSSKMKRALMPLLKTVAFSSTLFPHGSGSVLALARKPEAP